MSSEKGRGAPLLLVVLLALSGSTPPSAAARLYPCSEELGTKYLKGYFLLRPVFRKFP